jgi:hypothetical protein
MRSSLSVVVFPEVGNEGEDLSYIEFMVVGHADPAFLDESILRPLVKEFFASPGYDAMDEPEVANVKFLNFFNGKGYTTFLPCRLEWAAE